MISSINSSGKALQDWALLSVLDGVSGGFIHSQSDSAGASCIGLVAMRTAGSWV